MVVTVGFFDGVHIGHKRVLRSLSESGDRNAVVTFWPHPRLVLQRDARNLSLLSSMEEKTAMLKARGVDQVKCINFTRDFAAMTASDFIHDILVGELGCDTLVLGYDNRLGSDKLSADDVSRAAALCGMETVTVPPCIVNGIKVSSTRIREALAAGDVALASTMLGYNYGIDGIVVPGNRLGRTLGFPTANVSPVFPLKALPANGVYATRVVVGGRRFRAMTNIGVRPTLGNALARTIETNIFDFDEDIYGLEIHIEFVVRIRNERRFNSLSELSLQLAADRDDCMRLI